MLRLGLTMAALVIPVQIFVGDMHGLNTLQHQPQKIAAMEGVWETEKGVPLLLFAWPNDAERRNDYAIAVPNVASWILTHRADGEIKGLNEFEGRHPPVAPVFWAFRIMVGMGMLMLAVSWLGWFLYRRAGWRPERLPRPLLWVLAGMTFAGWVATVAGWYVTEIGRQPLHRLRPAEDRRRGVERAVEHDRDDARALRRRLPGADRRLRHGHQVHGREAVRGARHRGAEEAATPPAAITPPPLADAAAAGTGGAA